MRDVGLNTTWSLFFFPASGYFKENYFLIVTIWNLKKKGEKIGKMPNLNDTVTVEEVIIYFGEFCATYLVYFSVGHCIQENLRSSWKNFSVLPSLSVVCCSGLGKNGRRLGWLLVSVANMFCAESNCSILAARLRRKVQVVLLN